MCAAVADAKGLKRVCASCGIRFYDLNKRPIVCPNCTTEFTGEIKVKNRRSRIMTDDTPSETKVKTKKAPASDVEDDLEDVAEETDIVSLEDLDEGEDDDVEITPDADLDLDDDLESLEGDDLEDLDEEVVLDEDLEDET